ncbi:MAG: ankyrin repeat domain-containing protein [Victivallaceae bacterium]|nr:ankyrin repeat domain-containing protein [Victivallaceae bacterium]
MKTLLIGFMVLFVTGPNLFAETNETEVKTKPETLKNAEPAEKAIAKLKSIIYRNMDFQGAPVSDVVKFLNGEANPKGIRVILELNSKDTENMPSIHMVLNQISLWDAVHYICRVGRLSCLINGNLVVIKSRDASTGGGDRAKVNAKMKEVKGRTSLMDAVIKGEKSQSIKKLIQSGADVNAKDSNGWTALIYAVLVGAAPETIKELLDSGADVNAKSINGMTALMFMTRSILRETEIKTLNLLLKAGADINAKDNRGYTALVHAATSPSGRIKILKELLKNGADVNIKGKQGRTVLFHALVQQLVTPDRKLTVIKELLKSGADINVRDQKLGETPLMLAAGENRNPEIIKLLLKFGGNAKIKDKEGMTALDHARKNENLKDPDVIKALEKAMK